MKPKLLAAFTAIALTAEMPALAQDPSEKLTPSSVAEAAQPGIPFLEPSQLKGRGAVACHHADDIHAA